MKNRSFKINSKARRNERGVVLIAVLMFIAVILPVTLLILDSVRMESLLPVNEAYVRTAGDEADKGYHEALAAIMADQDPYKVDVSRDITDPTQKYLINQGTKSSSGKHEIDYLAESWARHPDNDTVYMVERSLENVTSPDNPDAGANPDIHSVPVRWQLMNVPFGMDDFGEYYNDGGDHPHILLPFEYVGTGGQPVADAKAPAFYLDPSIMSMMAGVLPDNTPYMTVANNSYDNLVDPGAARTCWQYPPSDPHYIAPQYQPRPASYFRNTSGTPSVGLGAAIFPGGDKSFTPGYMQESAQNIDRMVYDGLYTFDQSAGSATLNNANQYLDFLPLQQAVADSTWANPFFGSTGGSASLGANLFATINKEYKPAPGSLTKYQLGAQEGDAVPGWHETIVSDESGRFPINELLNIIFASDNVDYTSNDVPASRRDKFDNSSNNDIANLMADGSTHPNHGGYLLARDMLTSLLLSDSDMQKLSTNFGGNQALYTQAQEKAIWMIRQMLERRRQLDIASDFNRDGVFTDTSAGEIFSPKLLATGGGQNNDSDTIPNPTGDDILDGSGRTGDGQDLWDGTWRVYTDPKQMMANFIGEDVTNLPADHGTAITARDFDTLNQRVTVYSMDTEHCADPNHDTVPGSTQADVRYNINKMQAKDDGNTLQDESILYRYLLPIIGKARLDSIIAWRDGLVDLNGDGDLNDEYVDQPVASTMLNPDDGTYVDRGNHPVSTITYRERDNINFQNPALPESQYDPDYLNIKSIGDLLTIPMSSAENLVAYSQATTALDDPELVLRHQNGAAADPLTAGPIGHSLYPDFNSSGNQIVYDDATDSYKNNLTLTNQTSLEAQRLHPSYGDGDAFVTYFHNDDILKQDLATGTESDVIAGANLPPNTDSTTVPFWNLWPTSLIGNAVFEFASPDCSPSTTNTQVAFTQVAAGSDASKQFLNTKVSYNIATIGLDGSAQHLLTDNSGTMGIFDYAPDFTPTGDQIVFTRTSYALGNILGFNASLDTPLALTSIYQMNADGTDVQPVLNWADVQLLGVDPDAGIIVIDISALPDLTVTLHQPMFPSVTADGQSIVFMDVPLVLQIDVVGHVTAQTSEANIMQCPFGTDVWQDWDTVTPVEGANISNRYEIFPDAGLGSILPARQANSANGFTGAAAIPLGNARTATTEPHFTLADRQNIALDLGEASLALRESIGWGADNQNWLLKDLPAVPEQTASVLKRIADVVSFRDPLVTYDTRFQVPNPIPFPPPPAPAAPLQAYPGRVNINTADRSVLRTVFLNMFQGPRKDDPDDDGDINAPEPRYEAGDAGYINLRDDNTGDQDRFTAMMIADHYANQVVEYRKWIYDNKGVLGVTEETVPSNLPLYEAAFAGTSHYGNYRANPFYPLIDTNGDGIAPEVPRYDPEPPFRSIADLFNVQLYDGKQFNQPWTYEGISDLANGGGPHDIWLPLPFQSDGTVENSVNAEQVWGPIFNTDKMRIATHPTNILLNNSTMYGFVTKVINDADPTSANFNGFNQQQAFRLFSADDFKRIAPFLTVRTYNYRIESRGVVRVSSGSDRTDITRDKIWILTTNTEAGFGQRLNPTWVNGDLAQSVNLPLDMSFLAQNRGNQDTFELFFEETPQSGLAVTRSSFLPQ